MPGSDRESEEDPGPSSASTSAAPSEAAAAAAVPGDILQMLTQRMQQSSVTNYKKMVKDKYAFWETQPVAQFSEQGGMAVSRHGTAWGGGGCRHSSLQQAGAGRCASAPQLLLCTAAAC